mmetsp:Transcript_9900/g.28513  ORF Transcript_9900/g.28513 Transcript_9900/m.28513 type:complete len:91 (+) Transcript_9900:241-513(+)
MDGCVRGGGGVSVWLCLFCIPIYLNWLPVCVSRVERELSRGDACDDDADAQFLAFYSLAPTHFIPWPPHTRHTHRHTPTHHTHIYLSWMH